MNYVGTGIVKEKGQIRFVKNWSNIAEENVA